MIYWKEYVEKINEKNVKIDLKVESYGKGMLLDVEKE